MSGVLRGFAVLERGSGFPKLPGHRHSGTAGPKQSQGRASSLMLKIC